MKLKYFVVLTLIFIISCNQQQKEQENQQTSGVANMKLTSPAFANNGAIPSEHTCDGNDLSPQLVISDVPASAKSLALVMDDPDAPVGTWDHWIVFNIAPSTKQLAKGTEPQGVAGRNSWGRTGYGGPCPPSGTHRYFFKLYALDTKLSLAEGSTKKDLERAMQGHIIAQAQLMGTYKRSR